MKQAVTICLATAALLALSGCQSINRTVDSLTPDTSQKTFTAPSYHGKELSKEFVTIQSKEHNGHDFRGFDIGKRHWEF